jgi:hypothetical protein
MTNLGFLSHLRLLWNIFPNKEYARLLKIGNPKLDEILDIAKVFRKKTKETIDVR